MAANFGWFKGEVIALWLTDGRNMQLTQPFAYIDPRGKEWVAPQGSVVNGASIPGALWSTIGGPYEGKYRHASVIHDVACEEMTSKWEDVHNMFYEACRCGGVSVGEAKKMYYAVYWFGPRWQTPAAGAAPLATFGTGVSGLGPAAFALKPVVVDPQELKAVMAYIQKKNPSLAELRKLTPQKAGAQPKAKVGGAKKKKAPKKAKKKPKG